MLNQQYANVHRPDSKVQALQMAVDDLQLLAKWYTFRVERLPKAKYMYMSDMWTDCKH